MVNIGKKQKRGDYQMKSMVRKLVAGTLLCSMAFTQAPLWNMPAVQVKAQEVEIYETLNVKLGCKCAFLLSLKDTWKAEDCTFKSEDENIVQVSKEGVIFAVSSGTANVIVTHKSGESFSCKVDVFGDCGFVIDKEKISETATISGVAQCDRECTPGGLKEAYIPEYAYNGTTENCAFEVIRIRKHAFKGQDNLEKVVIPKTMQIIQEEAFKDCEALKTVVFLSNNAEIAENAFDNTEMTFLGYKGSSAEEYAAAHDNITFQEISENEEMPKLKEEILVARIYEHVVNEPYEGKVIKRANDIDTLFLDGEGEKVSLIPFITGSKYAREDITYAVKDENIVSVENETVCAKVAGKTVITLSLPNGVTRELNVVVEGEKKPEGTAAPTETPEPSEEVSQKKKTTSLTWKAKKQTMKVGKTYTFKVKVKNSNKSVKWTVSNKKIATIQKNTGKLKAKKAGKVKVTATCNGVKKNCVVTIKK